jgi:hypothetical protein
MTKPTIIFLFATAVFLITSIVTDSHQVNIHTEPDLLIEEVLLLFVSGCTAIVSGLIVAGTFIRRKLKK